MKMYLAGEWVDRREQSEVRNPFDGSVFDKVPKATEADVEQAIRAAVEGARIMHGMSAYERFEILARAARIVAERNATLGRRISEEEGKTLAEGQAEAARAAETLELSAEEAKRIYGEVLPLDAAKAGGNRFGFTLRVPCGIVAAITPFNFPLNLPCHKIGPALAAGNAVVFKPASDTPLSGLTLVEILLEAGLPPLAISCLTGSGSGLGKAICGDQRVRKISFTGSREVGEGIIRSAGIKRVTLELGSNSPLVVMDDADLEKAVEAALVTGYGNAGQVCISTQRVIVHQKVYDDFLDALKPRVARLRYGDQLAPDTKMGPMIRESDAERVESWIGEAVAAGARLVHGGKRQGNLHEPTVLADVDGQMKVSREELFGPAIAVTKAGSIDEAIRLANDTPFGLSAGVFTRDLDQAIRFARELESGNVHINWGPGWRADLMPYGGLKQSGLGKEGPRYAIEEMTELKTVVVH